MVITMYNKTNYFNECNQNIEYIWLRPLLDCVSVSVLSVCFLRFVIQS